MGASCCKSGSASIDDQKMERTLATNGKKKDETEEKSNNQYPTHTGDRDFDKFKAAVCSHKKEYANRNLARQLFRESIQKPERKQSKEEKADDNDSFWDILIDKMNDIADDVDDALQDEEKLMINLLDEFEKTGKSFEDLDDRLSDYLNEIALEYVSGVLIAMTSAVVGLQEAHMRANDFFQLIRKNDIIDAILPDGTNETLPPNNSFYNWSFTVKTDPKEVREIRSNKDIVSLVLDAKRDKKRVRVSVFRHSFSKMFSDDGMYHGLLLPPSMTKLHIQDPGQEYNEDFTKTWVKGLKETTFVELLDNNKIRVACGSSNNSYINLAQLRSEQQPPLATCGELSNVLQLFQGYCGIHAVACHGGGIKTSTVCDYITKLKMINCDGNEVVYEGDILKKMGTHMGMLGIVTEMELQYSEPYVGLFHPRFAKIEKVFPKTGHVPFLQECVNDTFYNEFFWFPFSDKIYVNCWDWDKKDVHNVVRVPTPANQEQEIFQMAAFQTMSSFFPAINAHGISGKFYSEITSKLADSNLTISSKPGRGPSWDCMHFRHGIQHLRILDMEWSFPLDELKNESDGSLVLNEDGQTVPDMRKTRDLWLATMDLHSKWDKERKTYPQMLPIEMRIIRGSDVALSCANGVPFVVYIEVLTVVGSERSNELFYEYCQELTDVWADVNGGAKGMRPHWAKYWQGLTVKGKSIEEHLKEEYADDIKEFNKIRKEADPNGMFMNQQMRAIFD